MIDQVLGNFTYFAKARNAYAKQNYTKARKYLDKYLVSRNQKHISFKDDPLMGSQFYFLKGEIDESLNDYCMALESYERSMLLTKKISNQLKNIILTPKNVLLFKENIGRTSFETFYDNANSEYCFRITVSVVRPILISIGFEAKLFEKFGFPGHCAYSDSLNDENYTEKTIYDYDFSQLKQPEDSNKSFKELVETFKRKFSELVKGIA